jgi:hypothetical protein
MHGETRKFAEKFPCCSVIRNQVAEIGRLHSKYQEMESGGHREARPALDLVSDVIWLLSAEIVDALRMTFQHADEYIWYAVMPTMQVRVAPVGIATLHVSSQGWTLQRFVHLNDVRVLPLIDHWELTIPERLTAWIANDGSLVGQLAEPHAFLSNSIRAFLLETVQAEMLS